jgi:hypothetical protein
MLQDRLSRRYTKTKASTPASGRRGKKMLEDEVAAFERPMEVERPRGLFERWNEAVDLGEEEGGWRWRGWGRGSVRKEKKRDERRTTETEGDDDKSVKVRSQREKRLAAAGQQKNIVDERICKGREGQ